MGLFARCCNVWNGMRPVKKLDRVGVQNLYICIFVSSIPPRLSLSNVGVSVCPPERHETSAHPRSSTTCHGEKGPASSTHF